MNYLIDALLKHPGPSRGRVGGKLPRTPQRLPVSNWLCVNVLLN